MPDPHYADPRLAAVYDALDADRSDLDAYAAMADELGARHVVDVGCGTGTFALLLAGRGLEVVGVDPARASLDVARAKPGADAVRWVEADLAGVPPVGADLVTMTGNAAQAVSLPRYERDVPLPTRAVQGPVRLFGARVLLRIFLLGAAVASRVAWWLSPGDSAPPTGVDWAITALFAVFFVWSLVPVGGYLLARRRRRLAPVPGALPPDLYVLEPSRFAWPSAQPGGAVDD